MGDNPNTLLQTFCLCYGRSLGNLYIIRNPFLEEIKKAGVVIFTTPALHYLLSFFVFSNAASFLNMICFFSAS